MLLIILSVLSVFLQTIFTGVNFPVIVLAFYQNKENPYRLFWLAFGMGLLSDFFLGTGIGFAAIFDLFFVGLISLFRTKFAYNWRWAALFIILAQIVWSYAWRLNF